VRRLIFICLFFKKTPPQYFTTFHFSLYTFHLMKVAILEICASTHYTLTNALIKTYSTDPNNQIVVYTTEFIGKVIKEGGISEQTSLVIFDTTKKVADFLKDIEKTPFDRLHICTIADYYNEFIDFKPMVGILFFHVHDIDAWFDVSIKNTFKNFVYNVKNYPDKVREIARFGREVLVRNPAKAVVLSNLMKENIYYIVLSPSQKKYLSQFVPNEKIIAFPSLINEGIEKTAILNGQKNGKIRICIPGIVTDTRRDYTGLFKILETILPQIKGKVVFDFLGFVEKRELNLLQKLQNLEKMGLDIIYSADFVDAVTFDESLDKADILLNNQKVNVSHTGKYGLTKESGLLFNIVRGAKPAIFPSEYAVDKEFEDVLMYYHSEKELTDIIVGLANGTVQIDKYKAKAEEVALNYTPKNLYKRLV
jgi:hypothetical protein